MNSLTRFLPIIPKSERDYGSTQIRYITVMSPPQARRAADHTLVEMWFAKATAKRSIYKGVQAKLLSTIWLLQPNVS